MNEQKHWSLLPPSPETEMSKACKRLSNACRKQVSDARESFLGLNIAQVFLKEEDCEKLSDLGLFEESDYGLPLLDIVEILDDFDKTYVIGICNRGDNTRWLEVKKYGRVTGKVRGLREIRESNLTTSEINNISGIIERGAPPFKD